MNFSKFKITTNDGQEFKIELPDLTITVGITDADRMYDYEDKCIAALKKEMSRLTIVDKIDIYAIIEIASDLWIKRVRFIKSQSKKS